ncbi:HNH endonuclease [Indioceanicola profundi]|uniref:HNH endonuclease n=1 Tax=Indioceanicola profundi TaxID=2220096 RepID=UPI000E6A9A27
MLYRSTDRRCRCGAPVVNLPHSASFHSRDKNAPSNPGTKHLAERQGWICPECGSDFRLNDGSHHIDHVIPWSLGGGNELANIQILHADCNLRKGARADVDDVIRYLQGRILNL